MSKEDVHLAALAAMAREYGHDKYPTRPDRAGIPEQITQKRTLPTISKGNALLSLKGLKRRFTREYIYTWFFFGLDADRGVAMYSCVCPHCQTLDQENAPDQGELLAEFRMKKGVVQPDDYEAEQFCRRCEDRADEMFEQAHAHLAHEAELRALAAEEHHVC